MLICIYVTTVKEFLKSVVKFPTDKPENGAITIKKQGKLSIRDLNYCFDMYHHCIYLLWFYNIEESLFAIGTYFYKRLQYYKRTWRT